MAVEIKWNQRGLSLLLRHPAIKADLYRRAQAIADAANGGEDIGYLAVQGEGRTRSRAAVIAVTVRSRRHNAKHNALVRALDAGRG